MDRLRSSSIDEQEARLRGIALADVFTVRELLGIDPESTCPALPPSSRSLIDLAANVALGGDDVSFGAATERALAGGASATDVACLVVSLIPIAGLARVRDAAESIVRALGSDADAQRAFTHRVSEGPLQLYLGT
jgi:alkylhydroperoxidase/carboxymuconolactone decarboxylase family protein YurZ